MKRSLYTILFLFLTSSAFATHERAGEITFKHMSGLTYEVIILTYTFAPSPADRPELEIQWGDGTSSILPRVEKVDLTNDIRRNVYKGEHTYSGASTYLLSLEDPNRNYGILNIPNSVNIPFYVETTLIINPFLGPNNSPVLLNPPLDNGCVGLPYIHNPGAYDVDGDSLSYKLVECKGANGEIIPGFVYPNMADPNNSPGEFTINPFTGDILWDFPTLQGEYNFAMLIEEWRNGIMLSSVTRDMQVQIAPCSNNPPKIQTISDTCVVAGSNLSFLIVATDEDNDRVTLTATGGPIIMANHPADFDQPIDSIGRVSQTFSWNTVCGHVQKNPYQVFFKAIDNGFPVELIDIKTVNILVNGPPVENLLAEALGSSIHLNWDHSICENAAGYYVYRRFGPSGFVPGYCETGVPSYTGYSRIAEVNSIENTTFSDNNNGTGLVHGISYCYLITAFYPDGAESYASNEACASLKKDIPIITNVSIENTGVNNGELYIAWSKPTELDTIQAPGPYMYYIYGSEGYFGESFIMLDSFPDLNDTIYYHELVNTKEIPRSYRVDLYNIGPGNRFLIGTTQVASSIFLDIAPSDNKLELSWYEYVSWANDFYVVYKLNTETSEYDSIGWSPTQFYADSGLVNGENYCYYVQSVGRYSSPGIVDPIINLSQIDCETPIDNVPPCPPKLFVNTDCDQSANILSWTNPMTMCGDTDVAKYFIYYTPTTNSDFSVLDSVLYAYDTIYIHNNLLSIAGCYAVTAIDSVGNQSNFSNIVCVSIDSCSIYKIPNVFTPNSDGYNDLLVPFPYTSVENIALKIFNRWGRIVFETTDPDINWDGKDQQTNQQCSDGGYYYVCEVNEITLQGPRKRNIQGIIYLYN